MVSPCALSVMDENYPAAGKSATAGGETPRGAWAAHKDSPGQSRKKPGRCSPGFFRSSDGVVSGGFGHPG
jgi:hypothetical protein